MDADFASWAEIHEDSYNLTNELYKDIKSPWYIIETFGLPWTSYELRLYNVNLAVGAAGTIISGILSLDDSFWLLTAAAAAAVGFVPDVGLYGLDDLWPSRKKKKGN